MKNAIYAFALLTTLAAATPQWGGPGGPGNGNWGSGGPWAAFPSCANDCRNQNNVDWNNKDSLCNNNDVVNNLNNCINDSSCNDQDKNNVRQAIAQLCANAGATITAAPFASFSVTSGGSAWPTAWTTNSAWASAVSNWNDGNSGNGGPPGWHGGAYGPFGHGGPGNGWGNGPWASSGAWTSGAWTQWWGTGACPASTWSGWTNGPWGTSAPWTSWTACTAETTASSVYTTTVTSNGNQITSIATSFGVRVAEATNDLTTSTGTETSGSGAKPTNFAMAGSAAGVLGFVAGALLL